MAMADYYKFTSRSRLDKAINSLLGILEGIAIDLVLNEEETGYLGKWLLAHQEYMDRHPFNELLPVVSKSLQDNILTNEEHQEITWLCNNLHSTEYYSGVVADVQRLQAILAAISADGMITVDEVKGLSDWLFDHEYLRTCYPYDEVDSLIIGALADGKIDPHEQKELLQFFGEFIETKSTVISKVGGESPIITGICATSPEIIFPESSFCFTGESTRYSRSELSRQVVDRGGRVVSGVSRKLNYLIVGAAGNPCWKYACYGMKIEQTISLRKEGHPIVIVHENDFHDAIAE